MQNKIDANWLTCLNGVSFSFFQKDRGAEASAEDNKRKLGTANWRRKLISQLWENREVYKSNLQLQKNGLEKANSRLTDYQILIEYRNLVPGEKNYDLYGITAQLTLLDRRFHELQNQLRDIPFYKSESGQIKTELNYRLSNNRKVYCNEQWIFGEWSVMHAAGFENPEKTVRNLLQEISDSNVACFLAKSLRNNLESKLLFKNIISESVFGNIPTEIIDCLKELYRKTQGSYTTIQAYVDAGGEYISRLLDKDVLTGYIHFLLANKYADWLVAEACLFLEGKQLAIFVDYGLSNNKLLDCSQSIVDIKNPNVRSIICCLTKNPWQDYYRNLPLNSLKSVSTLDLQYSQGFYQPIDIDRSQNDFVVNQNSLHAYLEGLIQKIPPDFHPSSIENLKKALQEHRANGTSFTIEEIENITAAIKRIELLLDKKSIISLR